MEAVRIDQETGFVAIDRFTFHPRMKYAEIEAHYPALERQLVNQDIMPAAHVYLPRLNFLNFQVEARLAFYQRYISGIYFAPAIGGAAWDDKLHALVVWSQHIKHWLYAQFGPPHQVEPPVLLNEDQWLSTDEIAQLDYWIYSYPWGEFGYTFHWETAATVHIHFDLPSQFGGWEGLRDQCQYLRAVNHWQLQEKTRNQPLIETLIDILSVHYDYMSVRALVSPDLGCLILDLPRWATKVTVDVRPDDPEMPYLIARDDTARKVPASAESLIASLSLFLEVEAL